MAKPKVWKFLSVLMVLALLLVVVSAARAGKSSEHDSLLRSYEVGDTVSAVSMSVDGSFTAAGSGRTGNKVYLFDSSSVVSTPAHVEEPEYECWAVIAGMSDYQKALQGTTPGCAEDAKGLFELLSPTWGEEHMKLLLDSEATKAKIHTAVNWLVRNADTNDTVLFYYAGHGYKGGWLAPYDAYTDEYWLSYHELNRWLSALKSKRLVIILNHSVPEPDKLSGSGRVVLAASHADEVVWYMTIDTDDYHTLFGYHLLEALTHFSIADDNGDYELSAEEMFHYAEPKTIEVSSEWGKTQHPVLSDQYSGELSLLAEFIFTTEPKLPSGHNILFWDYEEYPSVPLVLHWAPGSIHDLRIVSPIDMGRGTRYVFTSWNDGDTLVSRIISRGGAYTANYQKQYQLLIKSVYGKPKGAGWYDAGSSATISTTSVEEPTTKHIFTGWSGDYSGKAGTASVIMNSPKTVTANWRTEYLLTIESAYGKPEGAGWYDAGSTVPISLAPSEGLLIRHIFTGWSGDCSEVTPTITLTMNSPMAITANWRTDYTQLYILIAGLVVLAAATIIGLRIRRRREAA